MSFLVPSLSSLTLALVPLAAPAVESGSGGTMMERPAIEDSMAVWQQLSQGARPPEVRQVRIEQHIIWRIAPMPGPARGNLTAIAPPRPPAPRMVERKMSDCIPMNWIAGAQPQGTSRLLLFLRDRRLVAANLERGCSARDFYRGFYLEKPDADGRLCADRDRILARSGARCEISSFRLLVPED